ncbi:MAG: hypothetical protein L0H23_05905 [Luteimonas sp.]|nr:hypothetical protein [Luteimonas sp.]
MRSMARAWLLPVVLALAGCGALPGGADVEVARIASPDGAVDAVLTELNPGATASFVYRIHVVAHGDVWDGSPVAAELYGATRNASAYGVDLQWRDAGTLEARYLQARSVEQPRRTLEVDGHAITIVLREGVENPDAPAGGMARGG